MRRLVQLEWSGICRGARGRLFTGEFIRKTGKDRDSDFYYLAIRHTF